MESTAPGAYSQQIEETQIDCGKSEKISSNISKYNVSSAPSKGGVSFDITTTSIQEYQEDHHLLMSNISNSYFKNYCGLGSKDPVQRFQAQKRFGGCLIISAVLLLVTLFVIIPAIITSLVNKSSLDVESVTLQYPTNTTFQSTTVQKFSGAGSLKAKAKLGTLDIYWENAGVSTQVIALSSSGTITVGGSSAITMTSDATVVNEQAMSDMLLYAVDATVVNWKFDGSADVTFITTAKVQLSKSVQLNGYQDFPVAPVLNSVTTLAGVDNTLSTSISATMTSVASMEMHLGQNMYFSVMSNNTVVGVGMIPNFVMSTGSFNINATVNLTYSNEQEYQQVMRVLSNYSMELETPMTMFGFYTETPIVWLAPALSSMKMDSKMPGATDPFLQMFYLYNKVPPVGIPFQMVIYNPEAVPLNVTAINGILIYQGVTIANVNEAGLSIYCPSFVNTTSPEMISTSDPSGEALIKFNELILAGSGLVDTVATLTFTLGNSFDAVVSYEQYNILLVVVPIA